MSSPFFITTYDQTSGSLICDLLNEHPKIHCTHLFSDPFLTGQNPLTHALHQYVLEEKTRVQGQVIAWSAYELQHKILAERLKTPIKKVNLIIDPKLRMNWILANWYQHDEDVKKTSNLIKENIAKFEKAKHALPFYHKINHTYQHIRITAANAGVDIHNPHHDLFIQALTKVITYDTADLPTPTHAFSLNALLTDIESQRQLIRYISHQKIELASDDLFAFQSRACLLAEQISKRSHMTWDAWHETLYQLFMNARLETIYSPHITQSLNDLYEKKNQKNAQQTESVYTKLISIQMNSNRPAQIAAFFDNIEETAEEPECIEVLVNIDDDDETMDSLLQAEMTIRRFTIKYIKSKRPKSFCDLWQPINKLLTITDPGAYFLLNISDEMLFATSGWDSILKKYVGYFPDHIFRLRTSRNKFRNYFDRWECSFAQDAIPITTKRWVDLGGDWNPCFGPDSFQQLVAFYLAKEAQFASINLLREFPITDIQFFGDIPGLGIDSKKSWRLNRDHIRAMFICQSYPMQLEARRRAMYLFAHILIADNALKNITIVNDSKNKRLILQDGEKTYAKISYQLSKTSIFLINQLRKLRFNEYFGGGKQAKRTMVVSFLSYLKANYFVLDLSYRICFKMACHIQRVIRFGIKLLMRAPLLPRTLKKETPSNV